LVQYNAFIELRNTVKEAFATMDVYLKKRWDLIPNLVEVVKGYVQHESGVIEKVTSLRSATYEKMSTAEKLDTNEQLSGGISQIMAVSERYPELKASQSFSELAQELTQVEDEIAQSRKYYNAVVRKWNTKREMFPSNIVAKLFHFEVAKMFEIEESEKNTVKVDV